MRLEDVRQSRPPAPPAEARPTAIWRGERAGPLSAARLALLRLARGRALLLAVGLGMLAAVVLVCTVPLFTTLVSDVQIGRELAGMSSIRRNIEVRAEGSASSAALGDAASAAVTRLGQADLSGISAQPGVPYAVSGTVLVARIGTQQFDAAQAQAPQATLQAFDYASALPHMHLLAGALPQTAATDQPVQVLLTQEMARAFNVAPGQTLTLAQFSAHQNQLELLVTGVWEPRAVDDPYWNGHVFDSGAGGTAPPVYPLLTTPESLYTRLNTFPGITLTRHWVYQTQPSRITSSTVEQVSGALRVYRSQISGALYSTPGVTKVTVLTDLDRVLSDIQQQQALLALPLYMLVAQIAGLALLFVAAMASLLVDGQAQEIATLKSRGTSGTQILFAFTTQGLLLGALAVLLGPPLAALLSLALVRAFLPGAGSGSGSLAALAQTASPLSILPAAVAAALLGAGAVALATLRAARRDVLAFRRDQGRSTQAPFWQRYYLDLALVVVCALGYLELGQFGTTARRLQLGAPSAGPLLLVTPALLLLAGGLLVLRLLPLCATLGARLAARGRGLTAMLALAEVERHPGRYARITLLLVLAVGMGVFAQSFDASLAQNVHDRVAYAAGADLRVTEATMATGSFDAQLRTTFAQLPGVTGVSAALRTTATTTADLSRLQTNVLAIDPTTFTAVAGSTSWRADYARRPLVDLLREMQAQARGGMAGTGAAPVWALVSENFASQLSLAPGQRFTLSLAETGSQPVNFVVGGIVAGFPTLYPGDVPGGFVVTALPDYLAAAIGTAQASTETIGPNEYWLRTAPGAAANPALLSALSRPERGASAVISLGEQLRLAQGNPVGAGMRGLLLLGAITALLLAVLGSLVQFVVTARQRLTQFAILRTVGMGGGQLTRLLLGEQALVYLLGLLGGTLLGLVLSTATLPFLQFSDTLVNASRVGVPPYILVFNPVGLGLFFAALLLAFGLALAISARSAVTIGLGSTLRLGED